MFALSRAAFSIVFAAGLALMVGQATAATSACIEKSGAATGVTRDFAKYEALLIIRQVTGNWPIESDRIVETASNCKPDGAMWTCVTRAKVCRQ